MALYVIETNDDGTTSRVLRDGVLFEGGITLEQWNSIVTIYFQIAASHLTQMDAELPAEIRRKLGLQSFVMSLTGLEAFTNTYFRIRGDELNSEEIVKRIGQSHG